MTWTQAWLQRMANEHAIFSFVVLHFAWKNYLCTHDIPLSTTILSRKDGPVVIPNIRCQQYRSLLRKYHYNTVCKFV